MAKMSTISEVADASKPAVWYRPGGPSTTMRDAWNSYSGRPESAPSERCITAGVAEGFITYINSSIDEAAQDNSWKLKGSKKESNRLVNWDEYVVHQDTAITGPTSLSISNTSGNYWTFNAKPSIPESGITVTNSYPNQYSIYKGISSGAAGPWSSELQIAVQRNSSYSEQIYSPNETVTLNNGVTSLTIPLHINIPADTSLRKVTFGTQIAPGGKVYVDLESEYGTKYRATEDISVSIYYIVCTFPQGGGRWERQPYPPFQFTFPRNVESVIWTIPGVPQSQGTLEVINGEAYGQTGNYYAINVSA